MICVGRALHQKRRIISALRTCSSGVDMFFRLPPLGLSSSFLSFLLPPFLSFSWCFLLRPLSSLSPSFSPLPAFLLLRFALFVLLPLCLPSCSLFSLSASFVLFSSWSVPCAVCSLPVLSPCGPFHSSCRGVVLSYDAVMEPDEAPSFGSGDGRYQGRPVLHLRGQRTQSIQVQCEHFNPNTHRLFTALNGDELFIRAVDPRSLSPELVESPGTRGRALLVRVDSPITVIFPPHTCRVLYTGLHAAVTQGCLLRVYPEPIPHARELTGIWDGRVPPLLPITRFIPRQLTPLSPIVLQLWNNSSWVVQLSEGCTVAYLELQRLDPMSPLLPDSRLAGREHIRPVTSFTRPAQAIRRNWSDPSWD